VCGDDYGGRLFPIPKVQKKYMKKKDFFPISFQIVIFSKVFSSKNGMSCSFW
jgi:hypothetical protein